MKKRIFENHCFITLNCLSLSALMLLTVSLASAQVNDRSIKSDDFAVGRPTGAPNRKAPTKDYKFRRTEKQPVRRSKTKPRKSVTRATTTVSIGVTIWRLQPPTGNGFALLPVKVGEKLELWESVRANDNTQYSMSDKIRITVESPVSGYLYIINSELLAGGSLGVPKLIFPARFGENNHIRPGVLVDIPDQAEPVPYFSISPKKDGYLGELLTVLVSPIPLSGLKTDKFGNITDLDTLDLWESASEAEVFSQDSKGVVLMSKSELDASCGSKARELVREQQDPCAKTRQLTRDEPLPAMIFRVKTKKGMPAAAFVRLSVR